MNTPRSIQTGYVATTSTSYRIDINNVNTAATATGCESAREGIAAVFSR